MYFFRIFAYFYLSQSVFSFSKSYTECHNHKSHIFNAKSPINLPSLTEVFPEINYFLNIFKTKKGNCKTDDDCLFPLKCCDNPLDKYNKMCCFGNGQKIETQKNIFAYEKFT
jgi:hypothetical protein